MPQLSPEQLAQVEQWAAEGANLNQVQDRLKRDFGINLTYMDARLLMLDVGVRIKDKPKPVEKPAEPAAPEASPPDAAETEAGEEAAWETPEAATNDEAPPAGALQMSADTLAIPGALISGKVTFSDGQQASWFLDQMGRLGLSGAPQGYQPPKADIPLFQQQLDTMLQRAGF